MRNQRGYSLIEMILATAMGALILFSVVRFTRPSLEYLQKFSLKRKMTSEARQCMDTMVNLLRSGQPETVSTGAFAGASAPPPNSMITFTGRKNTGYRVYWTDPYSVYLSSGDVTTNTWSPSQLLANNVSQLTFSWNTADPGLVTIQLRMEGVVGQDRLSFDIPNQSVRLGTAP